MPLIIFSSGTGPSGKDTHFEPASSQNPKGKSSPESSFSHRTSHGKPAQSHLPETFRREPWIPPPEKRKTFPDWKSSPGTAPSSHGRKRSHTALPGAGPPPHGLSDGRPQLPHSVLIIPLRHDRLPAGGQSFQGNQKGPDIRSGACTQSKYFFARSGGQLSPGRPRRRSSSVT